MRARFLFHLVWLTSLPVLGQSMRFQQVSTADGLSDNAITKLLQDRDGFLWIGTENGLNRFDGHHIRSWQTTQGLSGEHVTDIIQDGGGAIWVASHEGGLTRFSAEGEVTRTYRPDPADPKAIANVRITCLFDLNDSILMIGAQRTPIIYLNKSTGQFTYWNDPGPIIPSAAMTTPVYGNDWCNYISDIGEGRLAIGFLLGYRQCVVDLATGVVIGPAFKMEGPNDQTIVHAVRVGDRLYGAGWQHHLHVHDLVTNAETTWPTPDECTVLLRADSLHLLAGTSSNGLLRVDIRTGMSEVFRQRRGDPRSLSDDRIRALLRDREGRTWVGTRNGLNLYAPQRWYANSIPLGQTEGSASPAPFPFSIAERMNGDLDICTTEGVFHYSTDGTMRHTPVTSDRGPLRATGMLEHAPMNFLGAEEGIFRWTEGDTKAKSWPVRVVEPAGDHSHEDSLPTFPSLFQVRSMILDTVYGVPTLVMGVLGYGIALLDLERNNIEYFTNLPGKPLSIGSNLTKKLVRDRNGSYWAGTSYGLYQWQLDRRSPSNLFRAFLADDKDHPLPSNNVMDLIADDRGMLWIATRNGGLASWDGRTMRSIAMPASAGNTVYGLAMDSDGRLWCAGRGCFAVLDTATTTWDLIPLQGTQDIPTVAACIRSLRDGRIAFIANDALLLFAPGDIRVPSDPPLPYLTALELADSSVIDRLQGGVLKLTANAGLLHVAVSALDLSPLSPFRYTIELEGVDPVPRFTDESGSMVYASLPSGTYRLLARTVASNGVSSAPVELAVIDKAAPIWQRWWFYLVIGAITGALAYGASRYNYRQKLKLQQVRNRIAGDLHDEVGSSLSAITIGSQMAVKLSSLEDPQVKSLLVRIGETSSTSLRSMSDIVWAIDPKNDEGEALVKRMRRIANELLESKGVEVSFIVSGRVEELRLPMSLRKELLLIFKEVVHNISKHSGATEVSITLEKHAKGLSLAIVDDGKGFDPQLHPDGHGLTSMAARAKVAHAAFDLKSSPGKGTSVTVVIATSRLRG